MPWTPEQLDDLTALTFVITGANSGIGLEAARLLARRGARVVLACRTPSKADEAVRRIRAERDDARLDVMALDLASLASVRAFADALGQKFPDGIDVLVNNAGVMALPRTLTADGFEMQLGTNHLGHFALTGLVLPLLAKRTAARVVNISSGIHWGGRIDFDDLMGERRYERWTAYAQSKLANLLFTRALHRRLAKAHPNVITLAAHPGYSATNLQVTSAASMEGGLMARSLHLGNAVMAQSAEMGALPTVRAAADRNVKGDEFYGPSRFMWGHPELASRSVKARDDGAAERLWTVSRELTRVDWGGL